MQLAFELLAAEGSAAAGSTTILRNVAVIKVTGYRDEDKAREMARATKQALLRGVLPIMSPQELQVVCRWLYDHDQTNYSDLMKILNNLAVESRNLKQDSDHIKNFIIDQYKTMRTSSNGLLSPNVRANNPIESLIADYKRISRDVQNHTASEQANYQPATLTM